MGAGADPGLVVPGRLELPTSTLSVWRSNQLSYRTPEYGRTVRFNPLWIYTDAVAEAGRIPKTYIPQTITRRTI